MLRQIIIIYALFSFSQYAHSHEIGKLAIEDPNHPKFETDGLLNYEWEKNHEKLTALSLQCLADAFTGLDTLGAMPTYCNNKFSGTEGMSLYNGSGDYPSVLDKYLYLVRSVRWSDDPTRQVYDSNISSVKFGLTMKAFCQAILLRDGTFESPKNGLLCSVHYGELQFLHSMAVGNGIRAQDTLDKILAWTNFAYTFSVNPAMRTLDYCTYWGTNGEGHVKYPSLVKAMAEKSARVRGFCNDRDISILGRLSIGDWTFDRVLSPSLWLVEQTIYEPYRLDTTFSFSCDAPLKSGSCNVVNNEPEISFAALGSILHMIQDSYSKSHVNRGLTGNEPEVTCKPAQGFYSYTDQDTKKHSKSDKWPAFNKSCNTLSPETLDPVTAVAQIIWHHAKGNKDAVKIEDIVTQVYGNLSRDTKSMKGDAY